MNWRLELNFLAHPVQHFPIGSLLDMNLSIAQPPRYLASKLPTHRQTRQLMTE